MAAHKRIDVRLFRVSDISGLGTPVEARIVHAWKVPYGRAFGLGQDPHEPAVCLILNRRPEHPRSRKTLDFLLPCDVGGVGCRLEIWTATPLRGRTKV